MKTIHLPAIERRVPLGAYTRAVRLAIANPKAEFRHGLTTWWPTTGAQIRRQFRDGLNERINEAIPYTDR